MTDNHPITPPTELVKQWLGEYFGCTLSGELADHERFLATRAAQWGSDQELLACGKYLERCAAWEEEDVTEMYNYRRPRPLSLKEQALEAARRFYAKGHEDCTDEEVKDDFDTLRRALEQLDD